MGLQNSGGISNPGLAYVQINYVNYIYTATYTEYNTQNTSPYYIKKGYYTIGTKSGWVYILAPYLGCILASIFHWKTTNIMRKMKDDTSKPLPIKNI